MLTRSRFFLLSRSFIHASIIHLRVAARHLEQCKCVLCAPLIISSMLLVCTPHHVIRCGSIGGLAVAARPHSPSPPSPPLLLLSVCVSGKSVCCVRLLVRLPLLCTVLACCVALMRSSSVLYSRTWGEARADRRQEARALSHLACFPN
jgi:hypothetical protein